MHAGVHHHEGRHLAMNGIRCQNSIGGLGKLIAHCMHTKVEAPTVNTQLHGSADDEIRNEFHLLVPECALSTSQIATPHNGPGDEALTAKATLNIFVEKPT